MSQFQSIQLISVNFSQPPVRQNKKFSSVWNCNIISTFIKKPNFHKRNWLPLNSFEDRCKNKLG